MTPVEPPLFDGARSVVIAKDQPQYEPVPASVDAQGLVLTEWEPTAEELDALLQGGRLRLWTWTFNRGFSPIALEAVGPDCGLRGVR